MRFLHCICAVLLFWAAPAYAQQVQLGASSGYTIFLRGTPLGRDDISITTDASGTTVSSRSRLGLPLNVTLRRVEIKYGPDWTPASFASEGTLNDADLTVQTADDLMMPVALTLDEHASIEDAASMMTSEDTHHVLVIAGDGALVGVVSAKDLAGWLAS